MNASMLWRPIRHGIGAAVVLSLAIVVIGRAQTSNTPLDIPKSATALEGVPDVVRIDATKERVTRRTLDVAEGLESRLRIEMADGRFYWTSRDRPLTVSSSGAFTSEGLPHHITSVVTNR